MRSTALVWSADGRFSTHWRVRCRFCVVFDVVASPITHRHPSQNVDDIGARFGQPSSFSVLMSTTGVPKYRIAGSATT
jgi:hypothetical protein